MQYVNALTIGQTGPELDKELEHEVAALATCWPSSWAPGPTF
jgi:hypothetical protein